MHRVKDSNSDVYPLQPPEQKIKKKIFLSFVIVLIVVSGMIAVLRKSPELPPEEKAVQPSKEIKNNYKTIIWKAANDNIFRVLIEEAKYDVFQSKRIDYIERMRELTLKEFKNKVNARLDPVFKDMESDVDSYADWYYSITTSYEIFVQIPISIIKNANSDDEISIKTAIERDLSNFFRNKFIEYVIRPEVSNPLIEKAITSELRNSNNNYRTAMKNQDLEFIKFIESYGENLQQLDTNTNESDVTINWHSLKWRDPKYDLLKEGSRAVYGAGTIALLTSYGSTKGGAFMLRRTLKKPIVLVAKKLATAIAPKVVSATVGAATGAGAGALLWGIGSIPGGVLGFLTGLGLDWALNKANEAYNRKDFVETNLKSLESMTKVSLIEIKKTAGEDINRWFDHAIELIQNPKKVL